ncbi:4-hydroxybenzoate polyprenyltransferase [Dyella jiangningensis]|uniref:UbiA family prenyltransferase n=1 Tax=Dyella sp. AtDHG13 TaxID=1938897 RepID=UPI000890D66D|nr:UbiA family prenyltransferase [Dyella sp. AtDHG13]PXV57250.1 4-hydroxybenzoate polyprenyltransferase [Dyella sp. AtDHG13]SDK36965.1 4-hydroxybenzoate polyprenyltransferase [Dyella jiangningensis]
MDSLAAKVEAECFRSECVPLCVDLDGTLIRSDLLVESALALLSRSPLSLFSMFGWLLGGKAHLKREIAKRTVLDAAHLPYNDEVVAWVREQQAVRPVVLCTASDAGLAETVAKHVGGFDAVLASDGERNLSGTQKAQALIDRYGERGFDYVGNAKVDLKVWKHARAAVTVEAGSSLRQAASRVTTVDKRFELPGTSLRDWLKAFRVHQWIKNALVFLPMLAAHRLFDADAALATVLAFACFSLCASSVYITNDLLDLASDRQHHRKRQRPFAAGHLPLLAGPVVAIGLLLVSFGLAALLHEVFVAVLAGYYLLTSAYSLRFKRIVMLDVVVLATLYTSRIVAGTAAIHTKPSFWLLAFSMFLFLSLAMVKRFIELLSAQRAGKINASGRGYDVGDIPLVQSLGAASGYLSVLVLALYIDSPDSRALYHHPHYLWLLCPVLLYWVSRTWAIAHRGVMHDDPVVFAVTDRLSQVLLIICATVILFAIR